MFHKLTAPLLGLVVLCIASAAPGQQTPATPAGQPAAPGLAKLTGPDAKRAEELDKAIDAALKADRWDEAIAKAEELLTLRTRVQGPKCFETVDAEWRLKALQRVAPMPHEDRVAYRSVRTMDEQAETLLSEGNYGQAQPIFEKALEIRRHLLSDDHPDTAAGYNNVASVPSARRRYAAAQPLYEKALDVRRRLLTDEHPLTSQSYNNLALNLGNQGKYTLAQPLFEKALEINRRLLTDDHPDTAKAYTNVAANLNAQGKYAQAQPLYEKALAIRRRLLTDEHLDTAVSYHNLAYNLNCQGKYAQAQPLYEKALEARRRLLTDEHPLTAHSYNSVAHNLDSNGKHAAARPLFEKALEIRRRLLGDDHPNTVTSYNNLAANLNRQGKYAQAQPLFEKALEIRRRRLTDYHRDTATSLNNLASNLDAQGKYAQAQPLFVQALQFHRRLLGDDHPDTGTSYSNLASNLKSQGNYTQAQPLYEKALDIRLHMLGEDHPYTGISYNDLALNLARQGKHAKAQPLYEKALEIDRRVFSDDHPLTANTYNNLAADLSSQGKYAAAQPLYEKAVEIDRRLLGDDHRRTGATYNNLAGNLNAQGKYIEAKDCWLRAVKSLDAARLQVAFTGLERAATEQSARVRLAAVLARLGQPAEAWQPLEEDLGRGLLDELAARQDRRLTRAEQSRLRELTDELERLDRLVEANPRRLDLVARAKRFADLRRQRERASIALGEFQTKLFQDHGPLAGQVAKLAEIQSSLPADAALVTWVDIAPRGPNAADPDGEHWGVVVRSKGIPAWVPIAGTGKNGLWTRDDAMLANRVRSELRARPGTGTADVMPLLDQLRVQRLAPLAKALGTTGDGLPPARRLIVLPSRAMAGIPIEALLASHDAVHLAGQPAQPAYQPEAPASESPLQAQRTSEGAATEPSMWTVSYAPSGTVFKYLREQPRPDRHAGLLALGDPLYAQPDKSRAHEPAPDHGLLFNAVARGSNAASHGLKDGDVLLAYNGHALQKKDDLKVVTDGDEPIPIEIWRDGVLSRSDLSPGKLGVMIDPRPAREAITEQRKLQQVLAAARSGGEDFSPLPGTRREIEAIAQLFRSDDRPTRALLGSDASEPELDRITGSGELGHYGFIHLATHGVIDEDLPARSAGILTQTGLLDPLQQALRNKPVFDGRQSVREIQRGWELKAELATLSACETALGRAAGGEGFVGFSQALLMSGARSVCLSLWKVDDKATSLLMTRFYQNLLGKRAGLAQPIPKAEALQEAKRWLRSLTVGQVDGDLARFERGGVRPLAKDSGAHPSEVAASPKPTGIRPYDQPYFWAAFVLAGDPD
jgi:tetratricopeptide (TPR) repeat protein